METSCLKMINVANIFESLIESTYFEYKKNNKNIQNLSASFFQNLFSKNKKEKIIEIINNILKKYEIELKEEKSNNKILTHKIEENKFNIAELEKQKKNLENELKEEKNKNKKLSYKIEENKMALKELETKIVYLENEIKEEKIKKSVLKQYIEKCDKLIKDKDNLIKNEKKKFMDLNKKMNELDKIVKKDNNLKRILEMVDELKEKENAIKKLKNKFPFELSEEEKLMTVNLFSCDEDIICSFICKDTNNFQVIENLFYKKYPEYKELKCQFSCNGKEINKNKNLKENNVFDNSIINIRFY